MSVRPPVCVAFVFSHSKSKRSTFSKG